MACCTGAWPQSETADLDCHKKRRGQAQKLLSIVKERVEKVRSDTEHDVLEYCQLIWPQHEHDQRPFLMCCLRQTLLRVVT